MRSQAAHRPGVSRQRCALADTGARCHLAQPSDCCGMTGVLGVRCSFDGVICDSVGESSLSAFKVGSHGSAAQSLASQVRMLITETKHPILVSHGLCLQAAAIQWPEIFTSPAAIARKDELVEKMRAVRPVVETG